MLKLLITNLLFSSTYPSSANILNPAPPPLFKTLKATDDLSPKNVDGHTNVSYKFNYGYSFRATTQIFI